MVKSVANICGKILGEIEKLLDWKKNCGKKKQQPDSRTRGPAAPAVLVLDKGSKKKIWIKSTRGGFQAESTFHAFFTFNVTNMSGELDLIHQNVCVCFFLNLR